MQNAAEPHDGHAVGKYPTSRLIYYPDRRVATNDYHVVHVRRDHQPLSAVGCGFDQHPCCFTQRHGREVETEHFDVWPRRNTHFDGASHVAPS